MSLRFAGGSSSIDPQLSADIQSLDKLLTDEQLSQFVDIIVGFFLAPADTDLMGGIRQFASAHAVNARALKSSMRGILVFFQGLIKHGLTPAQVVEDCAQLGLRDSAAQLLAQKWGSSRGGLAHVSTGRTLRVNELVDMEWKFGVTASSHELQTVGSTFLQLLEPQFPACRMHDSSIQVGLVLGPARFEDILDTQARLLLRNLVFHQKII